MLQHLTALEKGQVQLVKGQQEMQHFLAEVFARFLQAPLTSEASGVSSTGSKQWEFRESMIEHYQWAEHEKIVVFTEGQGEPGTFPSCAILSSLYPHLQRYARPTDWRPYFAAVAEHIYPKRGADEASKHLRLNVWDPANGIFLIRDLELKYQAGDLMILPLRHDLQGFPLKIYVKEDLRGQYILHQGKDGNLSGERVQVWNKREHWKDLTFGDLHQKVFRMPKRPSMRSLFSKAMASRHRNAELPNPLSPEWREIFREIFEEECQSLRENRLMRWQQSS